MSSTIPRKFIDDLLSHIDIIETVGARIKLKKAGANFIATCPFHTEKSPSFTVSQKKQFYYCFGCGAHGDAISFLMNFDRLEFVDAIETLASRAGLTIPYDTTDNQSVSNKELYGLLLDVSKHYQNQLRESKNAIDYLKSRKITGETCKRYGIGYAPNRWDFLLNRFGKSTQFRSQLNKTGMIIKKDNSSYDRFRNRIMFPIRDSRGRLIGFGGRALSSSDSAKYLNSPETEIYHKGNELYGIFEAKQNSNDLPFLLVVEGYMDVIALSQHGISNVVATLGTATTQKHLQKIFRYTSKVVFCFDGDNAGKKAAWRALENTMPLMRDGTQALFLFLPAGEDPDSLIHKEGKETFLKRIKDAIPLSEFFFNHLSKDIQLHTMDGKAQMTHKASILLNKMPQGVFQQLMFEKLAQVVHMDITKLKNFHIENKTQKINVISSEPHKLVQNAIKLLLHEPILAEHIEEPLQIGKIDLPQIELLVKLLTLLKQQPKFTIGNILTHWHNDNDSSIIARLAAHEQIIPQENLKSEFIGTIQRLYDLGREQTIQELLNEARSRSLTEKEKYKLQKLIQNTKIKILR